MSARATPVMPSFAAGEVSPLLHARVDLAKYQIGLETGENFICLPQGGVTRRPGTQHVTIGREVGRKVLLYPFEFSTTQAYVLEFGHLYLRFRKDHGTIEDPPGTQVEIVTPYTEDDLDDLSFAQSADTLYIAHPLYRPRKLLRYSHTNWALATIAFEGGPLQAQNEASTPTVYASASTGVVTLTASAALFTSSDVGALFSLEIQNRSAVKPWEGGSINPVLNDYVQYQSRIYQCSNAGSGSVNGTVPPTHESGDAWDGFGNRRQWTYVSKLFGVVEITEVTSSTVAVGTVRLALPPQVVGSGNTTWRWARGEWSDARGWPGAVAFHEQRLFWGGSTSSPQTIWGSRSADYEVHTPGDKDDDPVVYTIASNDVSAIKWMRSASGLLIGTVSGEYIMTGADTNAPLTPTGVRAKASTSEGAGTTKPVRIGDIVLAVNRAQRRLHELVFSFEQDAIIAPDVSLLAEHLFGASKRIVQMAWQKEPHRTLWVVRSDGVLLSFTYRRDQDVYAWMRHPMNGTVESVAVIPTPDGTSDEVWLSVKRTIAGQDVRHIEYMLQPFEPTSASDRAGMIYLDASLSYSGAPVTTLSGLSHLNGLTVDILADATPHPQKVVTAGSITLERAASEVTVGLGYTSKLKTLQIDLSALGTIQGKRKRIPKTSVMFRNTIGGKIGAGGQAIHPIRLAGGSGYGSTYSLLNGVVRQVCETKSDDMGGQIEIVQDQPLPMTILSILPDLIVTEA